MTTFINYIIAGLLLMTVGCQKDPQVHEHITDGFYEVSANFISPAQAGNDYIILLDGDTLKSGLGYVDRNIGSIKLTVYEKGYTTPVYLKDLRVEDDLKIQFIKLGDLIDIYTEDKYTPFQIDIKWSTLQDREQYKVTYNDLEVNTGQGNINYIPNSELTGRLKIQKIDNGDVVLDKEITIQTGSPETLLQVSATEFLTVPSGNEDDPQSNDYKKVRVYYAQNTDLKEESYIIRFYIFDGWVYDKDQAIKLNDEFEIKAGEISPYILVYGRSFENTSGGVTYLTYDLVTKDGTVVRDHDPNIVALQFDDQNWSGDYFKFLNKFETFNITGAMARSVLSEKW